LVAAVGVIIAVVGLLVVSSASRIARWAIRIWPRDPTEHDRERIESLVLLVRLVGYFAVAVGAAFVLLDII
jgi:hypothetical protein